MRSKTEARAAKWMEEMGWKWVYEPEALAGTSGAQYTPDFYLPEIDTLIEVKPLIFFHEFDQKRRAIIEGISKPFALICPSGNFGFDVV